MKKLFAVALTLIMTVSLAACDSKDTSSSDYTPPESITIYIESGDTAEPVEVDVSNMGNPFAYNTLIIDLPEGFVSDEQTTMDAGMVLAYRGSGTTSTECYTFSKSGGKSDINDFDQTEMLMSYKEQFEGFEEFTTFSKTKCCGFDAVDIGFKRKIGDAKIFQRQYYILTDNNTYQIQYTTESEKSLKEYEESLNSIIVK